MTTKSTRGNSTPKKPITAKQERLIKSLSKILKQDEKLITDSFSLFRKMDSHLERILFQYSLIKSDSTKLHVVHSLEFLVQFEKRNLH